MKRAILLLTALTVGGLHAGNSERRLILPSHERANSLETLISGIENKKVYLEVPPVLVDVTGSFKRSKVWVELQRGSDSTPGVRVEAKVVGLTEERRTLHVRNLIRKCDEDGEWTLRVRTGSGLAVRTLSEVTFTLARAKSPAPAAAEVLRAPRL